MIKAFLSHSSLDKEIVRKIKVKLQRIWTYFDEDCFEAGEDFRYAITSKLANTKLFILFASKNSLNSAWVKFEMDEAFWQAIKRDDIDFVVLSLDDIKISQLPNWMKKSKFESAINPELAAQIIRKLLFDGTSVNKNVYMGREENTKQIYDDINQMLPEFPNIIALTGLNGIGRRTFASDIFSKRFSLDYNTEFFLGDTEGIADLYRKLVDENLDKFSQQEINDSYNLFIELPPRGKIEEIARILALYSEKRAYPVIVDNGAMLDDNGFYKRDYLELLRSFSENFPDHYLLLIHNRLPQLNVSDSLLVYRKRINALDDKSCYAVFEAMLKRNNVAVRDVGQVREISSYLEGYPPAIIYAVRECVLEGVDIVCNDKSALMDFKSGLFIKYLNELPIEDLDHLVLSALYNIGDMTIQVLSSVISKTLEDVSASLRKCLNYSIIDERSNGMYGIAAPINIAVSRRCKRYSTKEFSDIAHVLIKEFWDKNAVPNIDIANIIIQTILNANLDDELQNFKDFILPSNLLRAAKDAYNSQEWEQAEKYSRKTLDLDRTLDEAKIILFKALVRQENSKNRDRLNIDEDKLLTELRASFQKKVYYLAGFRLWKRNDFWGAIEQFKLAKKAGDNSIQLHRDLAECLYQTDNIPEAQKEIDIVMEPTRKINNPFILDLASKIAINALNFSLADNFLIQQARVDKPENVEHRKATYYIKKGDYPTAVLHASNACIDSSSLPQMHTLRMNIAIHTKQYDIVEEEYQYVKQNYKWYNSDIYEILYANMFLQKNGWKDADAAYNNIHNKSSSIALNLRYKILNAKLGDKTLPILERDRAEKEKNSIDSSRTKDILSQLQFYDGRKDNLDNDI